MFSFLWSKTLDIIKGLDGKDMVSELPDELLLEILSLLPTKDVVATMVLSKRWKFLWMSVPRLEYDRNTYKDCESMRFTRFIHSSLMLHKAPVLESLIIKLSQKSGAIDIGVCVRTAIERGVRELCIKIDTCPSWFPVVLPSSLYTGCIMLVTLLLNNVVLMDTFSLVSFPSLRTLSLTSMKYPTDEFVPKLLSGCPVLEYLYVGRCPTDNVGLFVVRVATLKVLVLRKLWESSDMDATGFLIDSPALELLEIISRGSCGIEHNMPKIEAANVYVSCNHTEQILASLTSLEQLGLCLMTSKNAYPQGVMFSRLVRLQLCTCEPEWLNLLMRLLKDSPKLRFLRLEEVHIGETLYPRPCWNEPSHVPKCMLSSLETFEWSQYEGKEEEINVARFILRNSGRLKTAAFYPKSTDAEEKLVMLMELSTSPRCSSICQLNFGCDPFTKRNIFLGHRLIQREKNILY